MRGGASCRDAVGADDEEWTLVIADGEPDGRGHQRQRALTHGPTDDIVVVTGALFVNADGTVLLCDAIAESFPPQCAGDRIAVEGLLTSDIPDLQEANGVRWAEGVALLGSVEYGSRPCNRDRHTNEFDRGMSPSRNTCRYHERSRTRPATLRRSVALTSPYGDMA